MLHLLDEVLVALLGEATALLSVKVHVVTPHLNTTEEGGVLGRQSMSRRTSWYWRAIRGRKRPGLRLKKKIRGRRTDVGVRVRAIANGLNRGHLTPLSLLGVVEVKLGVQAPPSLVVLVNALTTDGQLNVLNGTLSRPEQDWPGWPRPGTEVEEHVTDEITVAGNGDRDAATGGRRTVDDLLDHLHREVGVALVNRLEESDLGVTCKVNILGTVSY